MTSICGCSSTWQKPKLNGTCATCGGWLSIEIVPALPIPKEAG